MTTIQINNINIEFNDGVISYKSLDLSKTLTYEKDNEKSFTIALMQIINLIEFENAKKSL